MLRLGLAGQSVLISFAASVDMVLTNNHFFPVTKAYNHSLSLSRSFSKCMISSLRRFCIFRFLGAQYLMIAQIIHIPAAKSRGRWSCQSSRYFHNHKEFNTSLRLSKTVATIAPFSFLCLKFSGNTLFLSVSLFSVAMCCHNCYSMCSITIS